ncbi:MAG: ABC transporter permease subunit [Micromonosporaceae bacterium]|nr:ABC transporter permease subunit [Micromonosporaceae bacterium]
MINLTIVRLTLRGLFGRRRFLLLLPLPALVVGMALLADLLGATPDEWGQPVLVGLGFAAVLPVLALIVGASVLGSEIDDGTAVHILAKPLPRREIVLSKLLVAVVVTTLAAGTGMLLAGLVSGSGRLGIAVLAGTAVGALAYCALFLALSLLTRRPVLVGLVYVLVWEGLLTNLVSGTRVLSIQHYAVSVAERIDGSGVVTSTVSAPVALAMAVAVTVGATLLAVDRLRSFSLTGDTS